ncbi:exopolyphosphatase [Geosmithia morbida]|uniref:Exopolyphosphatase n=1 Tax=Geosmithia morbida TaxID=1094350 RepID=A0A9P4YWH6_9HYPO|nr:exopolyphosphatase [Geosmithia morbida]KAF4123039.1 exopolyphosphatase [Geosmithia morbida]
MLIWKLPYLADIDSVCSAVVLAYLRSHTHPKTLHIPLSNLPREDLALRPEVTAALSHAGLTPSDLLTLTELPNDLQEDNTHWLLVDHNSLTGPLSKFASRVTGCVDHHVDEGAVPADSLPRVIENCGSCMSLVIEETKGIWEEAAEQAKLARLGLAAILIDTTNLTSKDKTREKDRAATAFLEEKLKGDASGAAYSRDAYYREIEGFKEDISKLNLHDILRKDYKEWTDAGLKLGVSCVVQGLDYLVEEKAAGSVDKFLEAVGRWSDKRGLDFAVVMTTSHPGGEFQRHLFGWGRTPGGVAALRQFQHASTEELQLETYCQGRLDAGDDRRGWRQYKLSGSRKLVAPLLRDASLKVHEKR